jgi:hypothetical protein
VGLLVLSLLPAPLAGISLGLTRSASSMSSSRESASSAARREREADIRQRPARRPRADVVDCVLAKP